MGKTIEEIIETIDKMLTIPKAQMYWAAIPEKYIVASVVSCL